VYHIEIDGPDNYHLRGWDDADCLEFPEPQTLHMKSRGHAHFISKTSKVSTPVKRIDFMLDSAGYYNRPTHMGLEALVKPPSLVSLSLNGRHFHGSDEPQSERLRGGPGKCSQSSKPRVHFLSTGMRRLSCTCNAAPKISKLSLCENLMLLVPECAKFDYSDLYWE
jgi:hypothetical protein